MSAFAAPAAAFHAHSGIGTQVRVVSGSTDAVDVAYVKIELSPSLTNQFVNVKMTGEPGPVKKNKSGPDRIFHDPTLFETADKAGPHKFDLKVVNGNSFPIGKTGTLRYSTDKSDVPIYELSYEGTQTNGRGLYGLTPVT